MDSNGTKRRRRSCKKIDHKHTKLTTKREHWTIEDIGQDWLGLADCLATNYKAIPIIDFPWIHPHSKFGLVCLWNSNVDVSRLMRWNVRETHGISANHGHLRQLSSLLSLLERMLGPEKIVDVSSDDDDNHPLMMIMVTATLGHDAAVCGYQSCALVCNHLISFPVSRLSIDCTHKLYCFGPASPSSRKPPL